MDRKVISDLRIGPILLWMGVVVIIAAYALDQDLTGEGLRHTRYFLVLSYLIYPVFYGGVLYLLVGFGRMLRKHSGYIVTQKGTILVGDRTIPMAGLEVETRRNWLRLRELSFKRNGTQLLAIRTYTLTRPIPEALADLKEIIAAQAR